VTYVNPTDVFTECLMLLARSINPTAPTLFRAKLSPHAAHSKKIRASKKRAKPSKEQESEDESDNIVTVPRKLEWKLTSELKTGLRFAETRISDLICQNDVQALEFRGYGKDFITKYRFSPDAFVQMAFQAGYYGLYGALNRPIPEVPKN
jgi:carnitine O-acetyltransferase